jgi:mono/diheme cytochrome c family protein
MKKSRFPARMRRFALLAAAVAALASMTQPAAAADVTGAMTGQEVFEHYCVQCHGPGDWPGTMQLARTRGKERALLAERKDLAPDYVEAIVRHGLKSMPPFAPSDLTDAKLKALVQFLTKKK